MQNIEILKTDKFKNNILSIVIPVDLDDKVTGYNVLLNVLKRGSKNFDSLSKISTYLQDMYGANLLIYLSKIGDKLLVSFYISFLNEEYTLYKEDLWEKAIYLLNDILYNPNFIDNLFDESVVNQEIENHKREINSKFDDKTMYSITQLLELGLDDNYKIPEYGTLKDLEKVNNKYLVDIYKNLIKKETYIYASGNIKNEEVLIDKLKNIKTPDNPEIIIEKNKIDKTKFNFKNREVKEYMDISQGKISLLYDTQTTIFDGDYFAFMVFNSIFGGGAHSKLFNDIREKNSLCYYIFSSYDRYKGIMIISSGVEAKNFDKVNELIDKNLREVQLGNFTQDDIDISKSKIISGLKSMRDSMVSTISYLISLRIYGIEYTVDEIINGVESVTKDRIIEVSEKISHINTHYLMKEELKNDN